jgi:hypothetical protein
MEKDVIAQKGRDEPKGRDESRPYDRPTAGKKESFIRSFFYDFFLS